MKSLGVRAHTATDLTSPEPLAQSLADTISDATFVCAVLPAGPIPPTIWFELGLAAGLSKQIVVIADRFDDLPLFLRGAPLFRMPVDSDALRPQLEGFLAALQRETRAPQRPKRAKAVSMAWARKELVALEMGGSDGSARTDLVRRIFECLGAEVSAARDVRDQGFDLGVWLDELQPVIGGAILVEVKSVRDRGSLLVTELGFRSLLRERSASAGLLVYSLLEHDGPPPPPEASSELPLFVRLSIEDLISLTESGKFVEALTLIRNRVAHGLA